MSARMQLAGRAGLRRPGSGFDSRRRALIAGFWHHPTTQLIAEALAFVALMLFWLADLWAIGVLLGLAP